MNIIWEYWAVVYCNCIPYSVLLHYIEMVFRVFRPWSKSLQWLWTAAWVLYYHIGTSNLIIPWFIWSKSFSHFFRKLSNYPSRHLSIFLQPYCNSNEITCSLLFPTFSIMLVPFKILSQGLVLTLLSLKNSSVPCCGWGWFYWTWIHLVQNS